jgi:aspartyl-tRNA synthetase
MMEYGAGERIPVTAVVGKIGKTVRLAGWVNARRDMGKIVFLDLRDSSGIVQVVIPPSSKASEMVKDIRGEYVLEVHGTVQIRAKGKDNPKLETGSVEVKAESITVLNPSAGVPFDVTTDGREISEEVRLKHRYLDVRRPRVQKMLTARHRITLFLRKFLDERGFREVETPILTKGTPEGAREYIVPARIEPGSFYVLPQSPQQFKQLLMVGGVEKYFQIARCFRDEDSRGDRQPEFTQLDLEMSFVDAPDVLKLIEETLTTMIKELFPEKHLGPVTRLTHAEAMAKYKTDKPDLRKNPSDSNELALAIVTDFPLFEHSEEEKRLVATHHLFTAPQDAYLDDKGKLKEPYTKALAKQYDVVLNGFEIAGGSIRIHSAKLQQQVFGILGIPKDEAERRFGHMLEAFRFGAPPHGGIAVGLDRLVAILTGEPNIREVIAFPKNSAGRDLLFGAPSPLPESALRAVHIRPAAGRGTSNHDRRK